VDRAADTAGPVSWVVYIAISAVLFLFLAGVVFVCVSIIRDTAPRDDDTDEGDGGGGQRRDPPSPPRPRDSDPEWWPDFEREFAAYVSRRLTRVD
ncbi:MAG TPA: hypothetical protein VE127_10570, partial [Solirubrobacteraceae bacterium]|nr:hypothetical protein [Solirubrobacteraceae bacterium]